MNILGLTAPISHNTAASIIKDGKLIAFAEEERFLGVKYAPRAVPKNAILYCLDEAGVSLEDVDYISFGFDKFSTSVYKNFVQNIKERNFKRSIIELGSYTEYFLQMYRQTQFFTQISNLSKKQIKEKYKFVEHHLAHAASSFRCSGYTDANIITIDGVGENEAGILGFYKENKFKKIKSIGINQSLGWFYSLITEVCGFKAHSHEGKTMGLAPLGVVDMSLLDGVARLTDEEYFLERNCDYILFNKFGIRKENEEISDLHKNIAATAQFFLEEAVKRLSLSIYKKTGIKRLCIAGGVTLNCDMNFKVSNQDFVDDLYIQAAANDAGTALGSALEVYANKSNMITSKLKHVFYGPKYDNQYIESILIESKLKYEKIESISQIAKLIYNGYIVGFVQGRMEFGPRALGGRSILASPAILDIKDKINKEIKHRENWRPFAPSVLEEYADDWFEDYYESPYMLMTFNVKKGKAKLVPSVVHVDNTSRVQGVTKEANPKYYELINEFYKLSGVPMLLNTSFNDKEKPISMSPQDAIKTFYSTGLDYLVLEDFLLIKETIR